MHGISTPTFFQVSLSSPKKDQDKDTDSDKPKSKDMAAVLKDLGKGKLKPVER